MDETRELTVEKLQESLKRIRQEEARRLHLDRTARAMLEMRSDPSGAARIAIEGVLDLLEFERGFVLVLLGGGDAEVGSGRLEPLATRTRQGGADWTDIRNPEFAVSRSVIKRAVAGGRLITVNDCLIEPGASAGEVHRAVLCLPLDLDGSRKGVLYLDRALGKGQVGEREESILEEFALRCLPILQATYLAGAVARLGAAGTEAGQESEDQVPAPDTGEVPSFHGMLGQDEKVRRIFRVVEKIKDSDLNVCIFGESGTGKELLARAIHLASRRREKTFVAENCGSIPENLLESELFGHAKGAFTGAEEDRQGLFELANEGTLFLDEIGDMSEGMQRKLLRVLQEGVIRPIGGKQSVKVNVRVICASNRDLRTLVQKGTFRADLYYRLNVITLEIPPLRERSGDIPLLVNHVLDVVSKEEGVRKRLSQSAMKALCEHAWPGNVRELFNVVRRALLTCPNRLVARKDFAPFLAPATASPRSGLNIERDDKEILLRIPERESFNEIIEECERVILLNSLKQCAWNKSKVTKALRIPRQSLYNKIAKYHLQRSWDAPEEDAAQD